MTLKQLLVAGSIPALALIVAVSPSLVSAHGNETKGSGTTIAIGENGNVLVRGAEVTAVSGNTVTARTAWGDTGISWTVETDGDTDVLDKSGSGSDINDVEIGDTVSFSGAIDSDSGAFSVDANVLKNWSEGESKDATGPAHDNKGKIKADVKAQGFWNSIGARFFGGWGHK